MKSTFLIALPILCWFLCLEFDMRIGCAQDRSRGPEMHLAGNGKPGPEDPNLITCPTNSNCISNPFGIEPMADGSFLVTSFDRHSIYRLAPTEKTMTRIAGLGKMELSKPEQPSTGAALSIELDQPHEVRVDEQGNILVADTRNHRIGLIDPKTKQWTTIAGTGVAGFSGDGGPANQAQLNGPHSIAVDGGLIVIADLGNHRIRAINRQANTITTIAGTGERGMPTPNALARAQPLAGPRSLAMDQDSIWIALREGNSIWQLDRKNGKLQHVAGTGKAGYRGDGDSALKAELNGPKGIAIDPGKAVYIVDTENHVIRKVDLVMGSIDTVAGDSSGKRGQLARPHGIAVLPEKGFLVGDSENHRVLFFPLEAKSR